MRKLLVLLVVGAVSFSVFAQDAEMEQLKNQLQTKICQELDNLPNKMQNQIQDAQKEVAEAQAMIQQMKNDGSSDAEIEAAQEQLRLEANQRLEIAVKKMTNVSENLKAECVQVRNRIQNRLRTKMAEMKKLQERIKESDNEGSASGPVGDDS